MRPSDPLVKCECINVGIWIDLGEKFGTEFGLLIFRLIIIYFGTLRMHQIAPVLSLFFGGACPDPSSTSVNQHHNQANYATGM